MPALRDSINIYAPSIDTFELYHAIINGNYTNMSNSNKASMITDSVFSLRIIHFSTFMVARVLRYIPLPEFITI